MQKSTRHAKITGDFGEALVLYLLSRSGFECARIDHTGIDLIAKRPRSEERLGISVKCRSRAPGTEASAVNLGYPEDFERVVAACDAFQCVPYFAIVVDAPPRVTVYLVSKAYLEQLYPHRSGMTAWSMSPGSVKRYRADPNVDVVELVVDLEKWLGEERVDQSGGTCPGSTQVSRASAS